MTTRGFTLADSFTIRGLGLFTETQCSVTIGPETASNGIVFRRGSAFAKASIEHRSGRASHKIFQSMQPRNTSLDLSDGSHLLTIEHVMAALAGLGVLAASIELDGPEIPIGDGSALAMVEGMLNVGLVELDGTFAPLPAPNKPFTIGDEHGAHIRVTPAEQVRYTYHLDYGPNSPISPQVAQWNGDAGVFARDVAPARTYSLLREAEAMQELGLFQSFTPSDLLVIGPDGPVDNALRFENEPARHKLLDLIGDTALAGLPMPPVHIEAFGTGHAMNIRVARRLQPASVKRGTV
jgi:UDP-3-O-acyl-N-acetylglucosamine deacetylase